MVQAKELAAWVGAQLSGTGAQVVEHILSDSRTGHIPDHSVFFAFSGQAHDGHTFIADLESRGVQVFVLERLPAVLNKECSYLLVPDSLRALQLMAARHRQSCKSKVVGITGSNGKTIVKEWAYQLMHNMARVYRSPRSFNSQLGVPLSVWGIEPDHEIAILEAGISRKGEMQHLRPVIDPEIGLFTNIGDAHASGFKDIDEKIEEKLILFGRAKRLIYRRVAGELNDHIAQFIQKKPGLVASTWSLENEAPESESDLFRASGIRRTRNETKFSIRFRAEQFQTSIPFSDEASLENAMHALSIGLVCSLPAEELVQGLRSLHPIEMRLNQKDGVNGCALISDFYNSDLKSLEIALEWMVQLRHGGQRTVILSDIQQSDQSPEILYRRVDAMLRAYRVDRLIGIGPELGSFKGTFGVRVQNFYRSTGEFIKKTSVHEFHDESILLKGARQFRFERIEQFLEKRVHRTVMEIDLNALSNNYLFYRQLLPPQVRIMAMVKAFSYGSGGHEISRQLAYHGVDYLGVAYADEGVALRKAGVNTPVMVINPDPGAFSLMLEQELEPALYKPDMLERMARVADSKGIQQAHVHLEFNTGMNRLGMDPEDIPELFRVLENNPQIYIQSVFTHLTSSELPSHDHHTLAQLQQFDEIYERVCSRLSYRPLKHALNSGGVTRFPGRSGDMVRVGIGLYGVDPSGGLSDRLQPVGTLKSIISQIRTLAPGQGVGYGRHSGSDQERRIAVVAIGYADGLDRRLGQGKGYFRINGKQAPIVGNVCMDMTMCDVSGISCREGDEVIVFGSKPGIEVLAAQLDTIPYEILTSVSSRVKRVYLRE